jgi:hypothetical protein
LAEKEPLLNSVEDSSPTAKYRQWYEESENKSLDWRKDSGEDGKFYHGGKGQWDQKDIDVLTKESRPILSINRIKPTIDLQKGIEIRSRTDVDAKPRGQNDGGTADAITAGFKYIQDQNHADHKISDAFFDGIKAGIGWLEVCLNDDPAEEEIQILQVNWRNVGWDPYARDLLLDDARYIYRVKWLELETAELKWPHAKGKFETEEKDQLAEPHVTKEGDQYAGETTTKSKWFDAARKRVLAVQMYFKKPEPAVFIKYRDGRVDEVNQDSLRANPTLIADQAVIRVVRKVVDRIYSVIFSGNVLLEPEKRLPYQHNRYPLLPFICYMDEDGQPYGMIRNMKDPQREVNKSRSQYSHILSTRRVFFETGAFKNANEAKSQISRPDAWVELTAGALQYKRFLFQQDVALAAEHFKIMQEAKQEIQEVSGAVEEQMGIQTNARSGVAIEARQRQGATVNTEPFDNMRLTKHRMGELMLSMMKQYWNYEKVIRITDDETGKDKFITFNKDGQNNLTQGRYDIQVSEHPETETTRQWASARLLDLATRMTPDVALVVTQTAFEMSDVPNKEKVVAKLAEAQAKQDQITQQKMIIDSSAKETPPPAAPTEPAAPPMLPPVPGITAEEVLRKIMAGETWGAITQIKDTTAEKAAEFLKTPKTLPGGVTPAKKKPPSKA